MIWILVAKPGMRTITFPEQTKLKLLLYQASLATNDPCPEAAKCSKMLVVAIQPLAASSSFVHTKIMELRLSRTATTTTTMYYYYHYYHYF